MQTRDLLLVILAFQNGFFSKEQVITVVKLLNGENHQNLQDVILQLNVLSASDLAQLHSMLDKYLERFSGNAAASLATISGVSSLREELLELADLNTDTRATILLLPAFTKDEDSASVYATEPYTSSGPGAMDRNRGSTRFRILNEHARGGLGIIFLARDEELGRDVALKQIRPDRIDHQVFRDKFAREARITGQLEHPGIVPIYAMGSEVTGRPYYAMRFIKGEDLHSRITAFYKEIKAGNVAFDGPDLRNLLRRFIDVCNAIDYAHNRGILHRDLKPGNVMLGKFGETLVVDWGLAKRQDAVDFESQAEPKSATETDMPASEVGTADSETRYGSFVGSPAYAPPEQMLGKLDEIGPWSDVYSLGAMLYQLLTGCVPVKAKHLNEIIAEVTKGNIQRPGLINPQVPKLLEVICMKAMAKSPGDRFDSAAELRMEIERWLNDLPTNLFRESAVTRLARWGRHHPATTAAVAASMLFSLAGLSFFGWISNTHNSTLQAANHLISERSKALEQSNAQIVQQASDFRLSVARRDLDTAKLSFSAGQYALASQSWRSAYKLSEIAPDLRSRILSVGWARLTDFGRSTLHYLGPNVDFDDLQFSADGKVCCSSPFTGARVWNILDDLPEENLLGRPVSDQQIAYSSNGEVIASICDGEISILEKGEQTKSLLSTLQAGPQREMVVSNMGDLIVTQSDKYDLISVLAPGKEGGVELFQMCDMLTISRMQEDGTWKSYTINPARFAKEKIDTDVFISKFGLNEYCNRLCVTLKGAGSETVVQVWDLASTQSPLSSFVRTGELILGADVRFEFSKNGDRLLIVSGSVVELIDTATGEIIVALEHDTVVYSTTFDPNANLLVTSCGDRKFYVWNARNGSRLNVNLMPSGVMDVCFSPDGSHLAVGLDDGRIYLGNAVQYDFWPTGAILNHGKEISGIKFTPNGSHLLTFDSSLCFRTWNLQKFVSNELQSSSLAPGEIQPSLGDGFAVSMEVDRMDPSLADKFLLYDPSDENSVRPKLDANTYELSSEDFIQGPTPPNTKIPFDSFDAHYGSVLFHPKQNTLLENLGTGEPRLWDLDSPTSTPKLTLSTFGQTSRWTFSSDGTRFGCINSEGKAILGRFDDFSIIATSSNPVGDVSSVCFSPNGQLFAIGAADGSVTLLRSIDGTETLPNLNYSSPITGLAFSPDGEQIVTSTANESLFIDDLNNSSDSRRLADLTGATGDVRFSADGKILLTQRRQGRALVFETDNLQVLFEMNMASSWLGDLVQLHPRKRQVAYIDHGDRSVNIVDLDTKEALKLSIGSRFNVDQDAPNTIAYSVDGTFITVSCAEGTVLLIDSESGEVVAKQFTTYPGTQFATRHPKEDRFCFFPVKGSFSVQSLTKDSPPGFAMIDDALSLFEITPEMFPNADQGEKLYAEHCRARLENAEWSGRRALVQRTDTKNFHIRNFWNALNGSNFFVANFHLKQLAGTQVSSSLGSTESLLEYETVLMDKISASKQELDLWQRVCSGDREATEKAGKLLLDVFEGKRQWESGAWQDLLFTTWVFCTDSTSRIESTKVIDALVGEGKFDEFLYPKTIQWVLLNSEGKQAFVQSDTSMPKNDLLLALYWFRRSDKAQALHCATQSRKNIVEKLNREVGDEAYVEINRLCYLQHIKVLDKLIEKCAQVD